MLIGQKLGPYEVLAMLGAGGMGEVYKARDTRLERSVAIKVLPGALAKEPELRDRFDREARAISQLAHPHICTLFDVGDHDGHAFLVMELLDGEPLETRLAQGPLPVDQALKIAIEIASALDAAHRAGIVHRDLKPGNIMLTKSGAKLLDFGLAKTNVPVVAVSGLSMMPTTPSASITAAGTILGTFHYMAPEQIEGMDADARTDLFAFGCVLFEMLTGRKAFEGKTRASLLGSILKDEPPRISQIQPVAPAALDRVVQTCLAKDPDDRWQTARDLKRELEWIASAGDEVAPKPVAANPRARVPWIAAAVLGAAALAASFVAYRTTRPVERPLMRFTDDLGSELTVGAAGPTVAISPDGTRIAYVSRDKGVSRLSVRLLEHAKSTALDGTDDAQSPFFSPDGRWIGFFVGNTLKKVSVAGGAAATVCSTSGFPRGGGFWGEDGNIYFASLRTPIMRVPAGGGTPSAITRLDAQKGEASNRAAQLLPGGDAFLFASARDNNAWEEATILVQSVKTGERRTLVEGGYFGRYIHGDDPFSGHLIYLHGTTMFAAPMDVRRLALTGPAVPAAEDVVRRPANGVADYGFTASGTVVYLAGAYDATRPLVWINADGTTEVEPAPANNEYLYPRLSPDGKQIAVYVSNGTTMNLAVYERAEKRLTRLTFTGGIEPTGAIWAPDGRHIVFSLVRGTAGQLADPGLYWTRSDGAGAPQRIVPGAGLLGISLSPDGKHIAYTTRQQQKFGIWTVTLDVTDPDHPKAGSPELFLATESATLGAEFSPDGKWLAYSTTESGGGRQEVFVRPFPGPGGKWQASVNGGAAVKRVSDRQELMFNDGNTLMVAPYTVNGNSFAVGQPHRWSNATTSLQSFSVGFFDVTRDGKRAVAAMAGLNAATPLSHVTFLLNFADELRRNTPAK